MRLELWIYQTSTYERPFSHWLRNLVDEEARSRINIRLARISQGNLGDVRPVGEGVMELRIDWGPGYGVYFARLGQVVLLLLCGGDKRTQQRDIRLAKAYFNDFKARKKKTNRAT